MTTINYYALAMAVISIYHLGGTNPKHLTENKSKNDPAWIGTPVKTQKAATTQRKGSATFITVNPNAEHDNDRVRIEAAQPFYKAAMDALKRGQLEEAETQCRTAMKEGPIDAKGKSFSTYRQLLAEICIKRGKLAEAADLLQDMVPTTNKRRSKFPERALINRALAEVRLGKFTMALTIDPADGIACYYSSIKGVMDNAPGVGDAKHLEATLLLMRALESDSHDRSSEANADAFEADRLVPNNPLISFMCGSLLRISGKYIEAERYFKVVESSGKGGLVDEAKYELYHVSPAADKQRKQSEQTSK